jgi:hypothetical protein
MQRCDVGTSPPCATTAGHRPRPRLARLAFLRERGRGDRLLRAAARAHYLLVLGELGGRVREADVCGHAQVHRIDACRSVPVGSMPVGSMSKCAGRAPCGSPGKAPGRLRHAASWGRDSRGPRREGATASDYVEIKLQSIDIAGMLAGIAAACHRTRPAQ